ncbi:MAG: ABC transporter substrate binding protein, partial [Burkholderiaceae bacterium]
MPNASTCDPAPRAKGVDMKSSASRMLLALVTALLVPAAAMAQVATKVFRVGVLALQARDAHEAVLGQLQNLGYTVGKNLIVEPRYANLQTERLPELAEELVRSKVDLILAIANLSGFAARNASKTIPIVVWGMHGAVETGLVRSLARPGGNVTGVETLAPE